MQASTEAPVVSSQEAQEPAVSRRQDPELVAVPMTPEQEEVFSTLGLNPVLLLDELPASDNLLVRVVRPGEDADAVLEEARQQLAASAGRRRRRGARGGRGNSRGTVAVETAPPISLPASTSVDPVRGIAPMDVSPVDVVPVDVAPLMVEITPLESVQPEPSSTQAMVSIEPSVTAETTATALQEEEEPRRRRRRRSTAESS